MTWLEALILGLVQGLTEFLPVSSSGHLEIGKVLLDIDVKENLSFTVLVHFATVLSTITVFFQDIRSLLVGLFQFKWNPETKYISKILVSMIPVLIVGFVFREEVESLYSGNLQLVGSALIVTALLLSSTQLIRPGKKKIPYGDVLLMGIAQALAMVPGISRSGATISTGLLLKNERHDVAKFSFLMVLAPITGGAFLDILSMSSSTSEVGISASSLIIGFLAAYLSGYMACRWMINLVKKGNLYWFAIYCAFAGFISIIFA
jgi:undecaprenyl-diphosphatase